MIMTLFLVIDDRKKRKIFYDLEHSNWHHIKILQNLMKHFQYDMFGGKHSSKDNLDIKKIKEIYKKHSNGNEEDFQEIKDFRSLKLDELSIDGYVIIHLEKSYSKEDYQNIFVNSASVETDRESIVNNLREEIKLLKK